MRVNEIFYSIQGEGHNSGLPAVFLRFSGCNRHCSFCDTQYHRFGLDLSQEQIFAHLAQYPCRNLILTGGEPALQVTKPFIAALKKAGWWIAIETNGSLAMPAIFDWMTVSPKDYKIEQIVGDELKLVYTPALDPARILTLYPSFDHYFLQPCSNANVFETMAYVKDHPRWRLSLQWHRMINIR